MTATHDEGATPPLTPVTYALSHATHGSPRHRGICRCHTPCTDAGADPMKPPTAILIGGAPATGKSTLAAALAPRLGAAVLDLDVATGPLISVVSGLIGAADIAPAQARTRAAIPIERLIIFISLL